MAHWTGNQRLCDSEGQLGDQASAGDRTALREETAQRLAKLLDRSDVNGTLIANLLSYDIEEDDILLNYVEGAKVEETEFGQSYTRSECPKASA